jgi:hypothetical protein
MKRLLTYVVAKRFYTSHSRGIKICAKLVDISIYGSSRHYQIDNHSFTLGDNSRITKILRESDRLDWSQTGIIFLCECGNMELIVHSYGFLKPKLPKRRPNKKKREKLKGTNVPRMQLIIDKNFNMFTYTWKTAKYDTKTAFQKIMYGNFYH